MARSHAVAYVSLALAIVIAVVVWMRLPPNLRVEAEETLQALVEGDIDRLYEKASEAEKELLAPDQTAELWKRLIADKFGPLRITPGTIQSSDESDVAASARCEVQSRDGTKFLINVTVHSRKEGVVTPVVFDVLHVFKQHHVAGSGLEGQAAWDEVKPLYVPVLASIGITGIYNVNEHTFSEVKPVPAASGG